MTNKVMWLSGVGIAAVSVLATAMIVGPDRSNADDKNLAAKPAETAKPSLLARVARPQTEIITVPNGTVIPVRLESGLSTSKNDTGDGFTATLDGPLVIGGKTVAPAGSRAEGVLTEVVDSGRVKGRARMVMVLREIEINGKTYELETTPRFFEADSTRKRDAGMIAGGAALGAAIGAIAGGGKGAAIGAGVGGGSGTGVVLATKGKAVEFAPETRIRFMLKDPMQLPVMRTTAS